MRRERREDDLPEFSLGFQLDLAMCMCAFWVFLGEEGRDIREREEREERDKEKEKKGRIRKRRNKGDREKEKAKRGD